MSAPESPSSLLSDFARFVREFCSAEDDAAFRFEVFLSFPTAEGILGIL